MLIQYEFLPIGRKFKLHGDDRVWERVLWRAYCEAESTYMYINLTDYVATVPGKIVSTTLMEGEKFRISETGNLYKFWTHVEYDTYSYSDIEDSSGQRLEILMPHYVYVP
jgi:hypothetical protein